MSYDYTLAGPIGHRACLGLLTLQTDETIEHDFRRLMPSDGVALYVSRVESGLVVTSDMLADMARTIPTAAGLFPAPISFDVVGYGCTSGTSVIGPAKIAELAKGACKTKEVTEPISALLAAAKHLGVSRMAFLSPYIEAVSGHLRDVLKAGGLDSVAFGSFDEAEDAKVARIDPSSIAAAAIDLGRAEEADCLFMSCTNLRTLDVIAEIEEALGKPVLSSNQVLAWDMARHAGLTLSHPGMGKLLSGE